MLKQFRKIPKEVEAIQYDGTEKNIEEIKKWLIKKLNYVSQNLKFKVVAGSLVITGNQKTIKLLIDDWLIVEGRLAIVLSEDMFFDSYEEIE